MKYWEVIAHNPFAGESYTFYVEASNLEIAEQDAWNRMYDKAYEVFDDEEGIDWDSYLGGCSIEAYEITYDEFIDETEDMTVWSK